MNIGLAIAHGMAGAGAALMFSLAAAIVRWIWLGIKADWRKWRERREGRRAERLHSAKLIRTEPTLRRKGSNT